MTDNQDSPHAIASPAPIWLMLLVLIVAIEIGALPRAMLAAVLP